jgi:SAM-dependent methyltransferase
MPETTPQSTILDSVDEYMNRACSVLAAIQLDVFTPLKDGPLSAVQLAEVIDVQALKLRPLLYALVIVGLLTLEDDLFANTPEANHYLVQGRAGYQGHRHKYWADIWPAALQAAESIRTGKPQAKHDYATMSEAKLEEFMLGLYPWTYDAGTSLARKYNFTTYRTVLDVGGGSGAMAIALTETIPQLQVTAVDLPTVVPVTHRFVKRAGVSDRVQVVAADLTREAIYGSYDAAVLKAFIQVMSLKQARHALQNIYRALNPGASIYILDIPLDDSRLAPVGYVLFNVTFMSIYDDGQKYTVQEYKDLLTTTGYVDFKLDADKIIVARKPV